MGGDPVLRDKVAEFESGRNSLEQFLPLRVVDFFLSLYPGTDAALVLIQSRGFSPSETNLVICLEKRKINSNKVAGKMPL